MQTQFATETPEATLTSRNLAPLSRLLGAWRGEGTGRFGAETSAVQIEWTFSACAAGNAVEGALVLLGIPGVARCEQKDLIAFDKGEEKVHWVSICSAEQFHDRRGSIDDGALVVSDPLERIRVRFLDDRRIAVEISGDNYRAEAVLTR